MNVEALKRMREMGLTFDQAIELVEMMTSKGRSRGAERQARYRAKKAETVSGDVTRDVTRDASPPPSSLSLSPKPPIQNPSTPPPPYSPPAPLVDRFWSATPKVGKTRSCRKDLERALAAAVRRGHNPEAILSGVVAYYASDDASRDGGQFAKGVHRIVENDRWQSHVTTTDPPDWPAMISLWRETGRWPVALGPPPDDPETAVPQELRAA